MPECEIYRLSLRPKENPSRIPTRWPYHARVFSPMNVRATVSRWCTLPSVIGVSYRCPGRRSVSIWRLRVVLARIQWHNCVKRRLETFLLFDSCRNGPVSTAEAILIKMCGGCCTTDMTGWFIRSRAISRYCSPLAWNILFLFDIWTVPKSFTVCLHRQTANVPFGAVMRLGEDGCVSTSRIYRVVTPGSDPEIARRVQKFVTYRHFIVALHPLQSSGRLCI